MANYKRKKPRKQVRCTLCTDNRDGNANLTDSSVGAKRRIHGKRGWKSQAKVELEDEEEAKLANYCIKCGETLAPKDGLSSTCKDCQDDSNEVH
jgi:hypothetical protein